MGYIYMFLSMGVTVLWIVYLTMMIRGRSGGCVKPKGKWTLPGAAAKKKPIVDPLDGVRDPKEAAVLLMLGMSECGGIISSAQKQKIVDFGQLHFGASIDQAVELFTLASFMLRQTPSLEKLVQKMAPVINKSCNAEEKQQLLDVMQEVAVADGTPLNADQQAMLKKTAETLRLPLKLAA